MDQGKPEPVAYQKLAKEALMADLRKRAMEARDVMVADVAKMLSGASPPLPPPSQRPVKKAAGA